MMIIMIADCDCDDGDCDDDAKEMLITLLTNGLR